MRRGILLAAVLIAGAELYAADVNRSATVAWVVEGCWLALSAHPGVDLGVASSEVFLTVGYLEDVTDNPITVVTNCASWSLNASITWTPPSDYPPEGNGLVDFHWWVITADGPGLLSYQGSADFSGDGLVARGRGPGTVTLWMGYRYDLDLNDVPGQYEVLILYTATGE